MSAPGTSEGSRARSRACHEAFERRVAASSNRSRAESIGAIAGRGTAIRSGCRRRNSFTALCTGVLPKPVTVCSSCTVGIAPQLAIDQQVFDALVGGSRRFDAVAPARRLGVPSHRFRARPFAFRVPHRLIVGSLLCRRLEHVVMSVPSSVEHRSISANRAADAATNSRALVDSVAVAQRATFRETSVKIISIETLRTDELPMCSRFRVPHRCRRIGLGETLRRRRGRGPDPRPLRRLLATPPHRGHPSRHARTCDRAIPRPRRYRALRDRHRAGTCSARSPQPCIQMLGGLCRDKQRIYNTCAASIVRSGDGSSRCPTRILGISDGPMRTSDGSITPMRSPSLLESGITAMKVCGRSIRRQNIQGLLISAAQMKTAIEPSRNPRKPVGQDGDHGRTPSLWNLPTAKISQGARPALRHVRRSDPHGFTAALADMHARRPTSGSRSEPSARAFPYEDRSRRDACRDRGSVLDQSAHRRRGDGGRPLTRPFAPHARRPGRFVAAVHMSFGRPDTLIQESVRAFYRGWYRRTRRRHAGESRMVRRSR